MAYNATIAEICREHSGASSTLYAWMDAFTSVSAVVLVPDKLSGNIRSQKNTEHIKNIVGEHMASKYA